MPITQRGRQRLAAATANYFLLKDNLMIAGLQASVRGSKIILSNGTTPLVEITASSVNSLAYDPFNPDIYNAARTLSILLATKMYRQGATLAIRGSLADRRAYRRAGFKVINDNVSARVGRFFLGL
jgi:hypothetical protein